MNKLIITIEFEDDRSKMVTFLDAFNEWARHPDIDALMARTDDTPTGEPESDYSIQIVAH